MPRSADTSTGIARRSRAGFLFRQDFVTCIQDWLPPKALFEVVSCKCYTVDHPECKLPWVATHHDGECQFYLAKELHHRFADKLLKLKRQREAISAEVGLLSLLLALGVIESSM